MRPMLVAGLLAQVVPQEIEDGLVFLVELLGNGLDVERLIVAILDFQSRDTEQVGADGRQVQHGDPLRGGAEALQGANGNAAEKPAFLVVFTELHIDEMPVVLLPV